MQEVAWYKFQTSVNAVRLPGEKRLYGTGKMIIYLYVVLFIPIVVTTLLRFPLCSSRINDSRFSDIEKNKYTFCLG